MKKTTIALILTLFATGSVATSASYAAGPDRQDHQNEQPKQKKQPAQPRQANNDRQQQPRQNNAPAKAGNQRGVERDRFTANGHEFRKGRALPQRYRGDGFRVSDWRARGLQQPPSGHYWTYIDGNYVLVAAATGIITSILINSLQN